MVKEIWHATFRYHHGALYAFINEDK